MGRIAVEEVCDCLEHHNTKGDTMDGRISILNEKCDFSAANNIKLFR